MPRLSVVMTVYNQAEFLPAAIESVLDQDYQDFELVVVDDGSSEDVRAVLEPYRDRVRYHRQDNAGLGAARNTGIDLATGEYVAFCDSDDVHLPWRLAAHVELLDQTPGAAQVFSDLRTWQDGVVTVESTLRERKLGPSPKTFDEEIAEAFGGFRTVAERGVPVPAEFADRRVHEGRVPQLIATYHVAWGGASMYRRSALVDVGGHDPSLRRWPDWYLASVLSKRYPLIHLDVPVLLYRQHGAQLTKQNDLGAISYHRVAYSVWKDDPLLAARFPEVHDRVVHAAAMRMAGVHVRSRRWAQARELLLDAIKAKPRSRAAYTALLRSSVMGPLDKLRGREAGAE